MLTFAGIVLFLPLIRKDLGLFFTQGGILSAASASVYLLGILKDTTGSFVSGFYAISGICVIGLSFAILLAQMRRKDTFPQNVQQQ